MDSDRLSGWKEIAAHLRRSVRAAQRWEHELGLPVKRVKTVAGQVVFASRTELDAWVAQQQAIIHSEPVEPVESDSADTAHPLEGVEASAGWLRLAVLAVAAVGVIAAGAWALWPRASAPIVESIVFAGKKLEARGAGGRILWQHHFDATVTGVTLSDVSGPDHPFDGADLDGGGTTEWLVPVRFGDIRRGLQRSDALAVFSETGKLRWMVTVPTEHTLTCGGEPVRGPWQLSTMAVPTRDGAKSVWIAYHHPVRWPSFLVEVTPDGTVHHRYVQSGWIKGVLERDAPMGRQVEVAGVLNERERASLVSLDPSATLSKIPAVTPEFACDTPAASEPLRMVLFPPHDVSAAYLYKYFLATGVYHHGDGLRVNLAGGSAVAMLDAAGVVTDITFIDEYWLQHDALYHDGRLDHPSDACPQSRMAGEVEHWDGTAWSTYPVRRAIPATIPRRP